MKEQLAEAFWRAVQMHDSGCWLWLLSLGNHGYGQLTFKQQKYTAHRVSWELHFGPIPDGLCVLHRCDNRRCCNPNHLFLGTRGDNARDRTAKGRSAKGEKHSQAKLTNAEVLEIRNTNELHRVLAERYGVSRATISLIKSKRHWGHLA